VRQGVLLRLEAEGRIGWGEIAPIEWFGSETDAQALQVCQSLSNQVTLEQIQSIPATLPACQFGFESAWEAIACQSREPHQASELPASVLLPTGAAALDAPQLFVAQAHNRHSTYKWKIGVAPIQDELAIFEELLNLLPPQSKLRLDANGGLTWQQACQWLQFCDGYGIEFLEQPLPPDQFEVMLKLGQRYTTPLALDESVTSLAQLQACYQKGWRGIFVLKAPIAGSPVQLREFCQAHRLDLVWSSVFETAIARRYVENYLIAALPLSGRATGFGVSDWFSDRWEQRQPEQIWQQLAA
jgi:O-succinylbenzoate synthase